MIAADTSLKGLINMTQRIILVHVAKTCLRCATWLMVLWWMALRLFMPTEAGKHFRKVTLGKSIGQSVFYGKNATTYVLFSSPVIALAIFALLYLELERLYPTRNHKPRNPRRLELIFRAMWTHPLLVKSPLGVLSLIEILGIIVVLTTVAWLWGELLSTSFKEFDAGKHLEPGEKMWQTKLSAASGTLGGAIPFTVALLFIPVTRGSPILRLIDVPFEQAVKYHRWIGHLTMVLVTLHGVSYAIYAGSMHKISLLAEWKITGVANLPGLTALLAGILMWVTSIELVRRRFFNFFFAMHHFYFLFFLFYAYHVGWSHLGYEMGPIFLFFVDKLLRFFQSRRMVTGKIAVRMLPSGHVELRIPNDSGYRANPLSFFLINVPMIAPVEWHPFSVTSSPLESSVTMIIKPLGDWTRKFHMLAGAITERSNNAYCPFGPTKLFLEGPYGHESNLYLRYDNLILISGGIGVTPFVAIIRDLLMRYALQEEHLPSNVKLIWCVKSSKELTLMQDICPAQIYPGYAFDDPKRLTLDVHVYVTKDHVTSSSWTPETEPPVISKGAIPKENLHDNIGNKVSLSANSNLWFATVIIVTVAGFVVVSGCLHAHAVTLTFKDRQTVPQIYDTTIFIFSLVTGIIIAGGATILLWATSKQIMSYLWISPRGLNRGGHPNHRDHLSLLEMQEETLFNNCVVTRNTRPNFQDILRDEAEKQSGGEVGVLVSGTEGLKKSVASACRTQNFCSQTSFHLHSVSFNF